MNHMVSWMREERLISIEGRVVGGERTFVIAEIGSNHQQELGVAHELIDAAYASGADAVKFQSINLNELYYNPSRSIRELHKQIDLDEKWHYDLKEYADSRGIIFFSSPTYLRAVDILESLQVSLYKLASAQVGTFPQIVQKVASTGKPTLLSTGIVRYGELEKAINMFRRQKNHNFIILHCNSIYPTPYNKVNLGRMKIYEKMFGNPIGFSDHTVGIHAAVAAVALGSKVIEKHFTLDKKVSTPDSAISLDLYEFTHLVNCIRETELLLRESLRVDIEPEEEEFKRGITYRLILNKNKKVGERLRNEDFDFKRHTKGIDCKDADTVIGVMKAKKDLPAGTLLEWDMLEGV